MSFKNIICENEYIFEDASSKTVDNENRIFRDVCAFLEDKAKCLVLEGEKGIGKSFGVKRAVLQNAPSFSRVYYIEYDKEKYLNVRNSKPLSIDNVLKKNIMRLFLSKGLCRASDDILLCFENSLDENTLLVIDNYDIPSFSPYLRHLLKLKCRMIVITRAKVSTLEKECVHKRAVNKDCFNINPLCEGFKDRYCEHFNITKAELEKRLCSVKIEEKCSITDEFLLKLCSLCCFDQDEKELLRTLCAMLFYLTNADEIKSSDFGVFDANSVKYYLGSLSLKLEKLVFLGFVKVSQNGSLYFDRAVLEFVMNYLKPDASNCPTFVSFVKQACDFTVVQSVKDTDALLYTYDKKDYEGVNSIELLDLYTHFLVSDENAFGNVYNILICNTLENYSCAGVGGYTNHLVWKNKNAYFSVLKEALNNQEFVQKLYDFDERYEMYPDVYGVNVLAKLDILRIAGGILNGVPKQMFFDFEICFDMIEVTLCEILDIVTDKKVNIQDRMSLLYDAIRIVFELFGYCSPFDIDGCTYNKRRSLSSKAQIQSTSIFEIDKIKAVSINMAYSIKTVKLYGVFQRLLYEYKRCADIADVSQYNSFYKSLFEQKKSIVNKAIFDISSEYCRIEKGYDRFYDFYSKESTGFKILCSEISDDELEEKINTCKRLSKRGFDGGTKTGSERFARDVLKALCNSKNALCLVSIVLSGDFEIGSNTYYSLLKNDFATKILLSDKISGTDKGLLLEYSIDCLLEKNENNAHFELVLSVVRKLMSALSLSGTQKVRVSERLCYAYIKALSYGHSSLKTKELFDEYFLAEDMSKDSAVCCFTCAYMCYSANKKISFSARDLQEAAKTIAFENMHRESDLNLQGFLELVRAVCGEKCAEEIKEDVDMCCKMFD